METMRPKRPIASAKINIKTIEINVSDYYAYALRAASPATPIANPEANALNPQHIPAKQILKPSWGWAEGTRLVSSTLTIKP